MGGGPTDTPNHDIYRNLNSKSTVQCGKHKTKTQTGAHGGPVTNRRWFRPVGVLVTSLTAIWISRRALLNP